MPTPERCAPIRIVGLVTIGVLLQFWLAIPTPAAAQEAQAFERRVLLENEHVYAVENTYEPGGASPLHTHRFPRVVYVVEGGTLEVTPEGGETSRVELEAGLTVWQPAGTHVVTNVGDSRVRVVEVEIKAARAKQQDGGGAAAGDAPV